MISTTPGKFLIKNIIFVVLACFLFATSSMAIGPDFDKIFKNIKENRAENKKNISGAIKDMISGMPKNVLAAQSNEKVKLVTVPEAIIIAQEAARKKFALLIDMEFHNKGRVLRVPGDFSAISHAIDAAQSGDTVLVSPGTYYEQLVMKDGVKLVSDSSENGNELVSVANARIQLPRRVLRTIIDGSKTTPSKHGMVDFNPGVSRKTIIDGFTIRNLPAQDHHVPGHAHGLNIRGASPLVMNCYIKDMGSTGIGSHVVYNDQESSIRSRDFRWENIRTFASAVIYNNIITGSLGLGIGCNHFASPVILGNEIFDNNDTDLGSQPSPGIGNKHGSHAIIIGNIVHDNPGGGILSQLGKSQGKHGIDRATYPTILSNVVYDNGSSRPGISSRGAGSISTPIIIRGNFVYNSGATGIALSKDSTGIVEDNLVAGSTDPGVAVSQSSALKLNRNQVTSLNGTPGIIIIDGAIVHQMIENRVDPDEDAPPYLLDGESTIKVIQ